MEWCKSPDVGLPQPDVTLFLDLSIEDAMKRGDFGEERYEKKDLQIKVRHQFMAIKDESWRIIDANKSVEALQLEIRQVVDGAVEQVKANPGAPVKELWKTKTQ